MLIKRAASVLLCLATLYIAIEFMIVLYNEFFPFFILTLLMLCGVLEDSVASERKIRQAQ